MEEKGKIIFNMSMSLDGFVAGPNDGPKNGLGDNGEALFDWYNNGDVLVNTPGGTMSFNLSKESAKVFNERINSIGVIITGRKTFDITHGWNGTHPVNVPVIVLTHQIPKKWNENHSSFTFVTDGIEHAITIAKKIAGNKNISISTASTFQQCLRSGLLDEIHIDLIPVILGGGVGLFELSNSKSLKLDQLSVSKGDRVIHIKYGVRNNGN